MKRKRRGATASGSKWDMSFTKLALLIIGVSSSVALFSCSDLFCNYALTKSGSIRPYNWITLSSLDHLHMLVSSDGICVERFCIYQKNIYFLNHTIHIVV